MNTINEYVTRWYFTNTDFANTEGESRYVLVPEGITSVQVQGNLYAFNLDFFTSDLILCLRHKPFPNSFQPTNSFSSNYSVIWIFKRAIPKKLFELINKFSKLQDTESI